MKFKIFKILLILTVLSGCTQTDEKFQKRTRFSMDTYVTVTLPENTSEEIIEQGFKKIDGMDRKISKFRGRNRVPDQFYGMVRKSLELARKTEGFYDPTLYPVLKLWGFYGDNPEVPDNERISSVLETTGYQKVKIGSDTIVAPEFIKFDLGGFAKGWVVDSMVKYFKENEVKIGMVDAGGDIRAWGNKIWKIGIKAPRSEGLAGVLKIKNSAVATSGDYVNYFKRKGKRYSHIINPNTGYPVQGIYSATVVAKNCALADGLSTSIMTAGWDRIEDWEKIAQGCAVIGEEQKYYTPDLDLSWR